MIKQILFLLFFFPLFAEASTINLKEIYGASPIIYSILLIMSGSSITIWLYTLFTCNEKELLPPPIIMKVKKDLVSQNYDSVLKMCQNSSSPLSSMITIAINNKQHGHQVMVNSMLEEGKRTTNYLWQRLAFLTDLIYVAPMFGLLGTVLGMFYAFYDLNRSMESILALFDGIGIAVGSTVAGLIVAIITIIFHSTLRFKITKTVNLMEKEALAIASLIKADEPNTRQQ